MLTYAKLALTLLQLAYLLASWGRDRNQIQAGEDIAIGKAALGVLKATAWGKAIAEKIDAMGETELSDLERELERDDSGQGR